MPTFQELLNECNGNKSIIIGNGFGISFDMAVGGDNFNWNSLLELCEIQEESELYRLLAENRFDFELVHQKLNNAIDILRLYAPTLPLIRHLQQQIQYLREQLIIAVGASHPRSFLQRRAEPEQQALNTMILNCRRFLQNFNSVFSLNYDLLLYWVRCFPVPNSPLLGVDSFTRSSGELVFTPNDDANIFFPHGSLFIYRDGASAIKSGSSRKNPILARLQRNIENGIFPMCISEGTGSQKLNEIKRNHYLLYSYNKIMESNGTIFTFGCSFQDGKDNHIIEAMCKSNVLKIVVGVFQPNQLSITRLEHEFARVQAALHTNKEIVIADSSTTHIW